jgi:hypothetical protein
MIVVDLGDTHCGSTVGLWPPGMSGTDDTPKPQNKVQSWIWDCWQDAWARFHKWRGKRPYILVCKGDLIEGVHHRSIQVMDVSKRVHAEAAWVCLEPHAERAKAVYVVVGTECHVGDIEYSLADRLGAERHPDTGARAAHEWLIEINGTLCSFIHHMPTTSRKYLEAGAMSIMLGNLQLNCARFGMRVPRVASFGHRHLPGFYTDGEGACIVNAPWQVRTTHAHKVASTSHTAIGMAVWEIEQPGGLPTWRYGYTYRPAEQARVEA